MQHAELVRATSTSGVGGRLRPILSIIMGAYILLLAWEGKGWNKGRGIGGGGQNDNVASGSFWIANLILV